MTNQEIATKKAQIECELLEAMNNIDIAVQRIHLLDIQKEAINIGDLHACKHQIKKVLNRSYDRLARTR